MGNEPSKEVQVSPSESNTDPHTNSQVPNNSPASTKTKGAVPMLQSSPSEDAIERDEGPSFRSVSLHSERSDLAASSEPIPTCTPIKLSPQRATLASTIELPFPAQHSQVSVDLEQTLKEIYDPSPQSGYALLTPPADDVLPLPVAPGILNNATNMVLNSPVADADMPARLESLTKYQQRRLLHQLPVSRTKLKAQAPEFVPRRELYDNKVCVTAAFAEITHLGRPSDIQDPLSTETSHSSQKQNAFKGRDLPPHLSFRDANHLYRPIHIRAPPGKDDNELGIANKILTSPKIAYPISPSPSEIVRPTDMEVDECNIPTATTYAEAANLAMQYPAIASDILVQPLSSVPCALSRQKAHSMIQELSPSPRFKYEDTTSRTEPTEPERPRKVVFPVAEHTPDAPNWAIAPLLPPANQFQSQTEERRRSTRSKPRTDESNQNGQNSGGQAFGRFNFQNVEGGASERVDRREALFGPAALEYDQPLPFHQQLSIPGPNDLRGQPLEHLYENVRDTWDQSTAQSLRESQPLLQPPMQIKNDNLIGIGSLQSVPNERPSAPVPAVSRLTVEETAKLIVLAKANNVDLADLLRLVESSVTVQAKAEWQKATHELFTGHSAPLPEARTEEVVDDIYWNMPEDSWGISSPIDSVVTSPPSVFVPTCSSIPVSAISRFSRGRRNNSNISLDGATWNESIGSDRISTWSSREGPTQAAFVNGPSNSPTKHAHSRTSTGDRREPWSRQQSSRVNTKYNIDSENVAAFEVVGKMEGDTKEVFLRYGTHVSSKAASSRAIDTNHHAEQMRSGGSASDGDGLTAKGGYGTFKTLGRRGVGEEQPTVWHQSMLSWNNGGNSAIDNA